MRRHHDWEDRPEPDLTDPVTAAAMERAIRGLRWVKVVHVALLLIGFGILALAVWSQLG